ncbi:MAG: NADH-ubiquinone oxidoreductase-F iron-sulfur binding region domain-containing protein [Actinomycetales bacterium]
MSAATGVLPGTVNLRAPAGTGRLFAAGPAADYAGHLRTYGPVAGVGADFLPELEAAGMTGRGGAAFASWRKLAAVVQSRNASVLPSRPVVIANGAEGEPLSFKDRTLLANAPHLVIDGLLVAAKTVSASALFIYAQAASLPALEAAVAERADARRIRLVEAPEAFVAGEASAVVNAIATGRATPTDKRRRLSESGFKGRPTLVHNVETLAHVALIARFGAGWFRSVGTVRDPGTRLVSVTGAGAERVLEVAGDSPLTEVLAAAGISAGTVPAVLVGGYHGRWVRPAGLRLSPAGAPAESVRPGAGVIHALDSGQCGLDATARMVGYLADASAKQCGPCMFGLPAMAGVLDRIAYGDRDPRLAGELMRLGRLVSGRGACHHPDGTVQLIASALQVFADDVAAHLGGRCTRDAGGAE